MFSVDFYSKLLKKIVTRKFNNYQEAIDFANLHNSVIY